MFNLFKMGKIIYKHLSYPSNKDKISILWSLINLCHINDIVELIYKDIYNSFLIKNKLKLDSKYFSENYLYILENMYHPQLFKINNYYRYYNGYPVLFYKNYDKNFRYSKLYGLIVSIKNYLLNNNYITFGNTNNKYSTIYEIKIDDTKIIKIDDRLIKQEIDLRKNNIISLLKKILSFIKN